MPNGDPRRPGSFSWHTGALYTGSHVTKKHVKMADKECLNMSRLGRIHNELYPS